MTAPILPAHAPATPARGVRWHLTTETTGVERHADTGAVSVDARILAARPRVRRAAAPAAPPAPVEPHQLAAAVRTHTCSPLCDRTTHAVAAWCPATDPTNADHAEAAVRDAGQTLLLVDLDPARRLLGGRVAPPRVRRPAGPVVPMTAVVIRLFAPGGGLDDTALGGMLRAATEQAHTVPCPTCGAPAGVDCTQLRTRAAMVTVHQPRWVAAGGTSGGAS